jgi:sulfur carrier protein ThiS
MSLADALSFNGEDAEKICMMADGSAVNVIKQYQLKEDGTVEIEVNGENEQAEEMRLAISVNAYSKVVKMTNKTLHAYIQEAGLEPVPNVIIRNNTRFTPVYWKDQVDELLPKRMAANEYSIALPIKNENGEASSKKRVAVSLAAYGKSLGITSHALLSYAQKAGLTPVPIKVLHDSSSIIVYWKDEVDLLIPQKVDDSGMVILDSSKKDGTIQKRAAVSLVAYSRHRSFHPQTLERRVEKAMLVPIEGSRVWSGRRQVDVYWKDEIDPLLDAKMEK